MAIGIDWFTPLVAGRFSQADLVVDPFSGSASTGHAAILQGRQYLGFETNARYVELSGKRLMAAQATLAPPSASGKLPS